MGRGLLLGVAYVLASMGCSAQDELYVDVLGDVMAEEAYLQFRLMDPSGSETCLDGSSDCSPAPLEVAIESQSVRPAGVLEVLSAAERPAFLPPWSHTVHAVAAGSAELCVRGRRAGGGRLRTACQRIEVQTVDRIELDNPCHRIAEGDGYETGIKLVGSDVYLDGLIKDPLQVVGSWEAVADFTLDYSAEAYVRAGWKELPVEPDVRLRSRLDRDLDWSIATYSPKTDISRVVFAPRPSRLVSCGSENLELGMFSVEVGGEPACGTAWFQVMTETPEVCVHRGHDASLTDPTSNWQTTGVATIAVLAAGTCRLRVAPLEAPGQVYTFSSDVNCD